MNPLSKLYSRKKVWLILHSVFIGMTVFFSLAILFFSYVLVLAYLYLSSSQWHCADNPRHS